MPVKWSAIGMVLAAAALFGLVAPLSKMLVGTVHPVALAGILYLGAGLGVAALRAVQGLVGGRREAGLRPADLPWLLGAIAFGGIGAPLLLIFGLSRSSAASGALLLNLEGLATMLIAWTVLRENVDRRLLLGAAAIFLGALAASFDGDGLTFDPGSLMIAGACLCWGIDNTLTRRLAAIDPLVITAIKGTAAGAFNLAAATLSGAVLPDPAHFAAGAALGLAGVGLSLVLFLRGLRDLGVARTAAYYSTAPFVGAAAALLIFQEAPSLQLAVAAVLMGVGVYLHVTEDHVHEHVHSPLEHEHLHVHDIHHRHAHQGAPGEPHSHWHRHEPVRHTHAHYPDLHHRHDH